MIAELLVAIVPLSWVVFSIWMAVVWPGLDLGGRIGRFVFLVWAGLGFYVLAVLATVVVFAVVERWLFDLRHIVWWGAGWLIVPVPYYFTWRYWRRERADAAGRH